MAGGLAGKPGDWRQIRNGGPLSAITAGCVSLVALLVLGPGHNPAQRGRRGS